MADFSTNIINLRFREIFKELEKHNIIRGKSDLANKLDTYNHVINSILKGKRNITVDQLHKLFEAYNVNANYLFGLSHQKFREGGILQGALETFPVEDREFGQNANIFLVSDKVRAGYAIQHQQPNYYDELPKFSLPNISGQNLIAFEIDGDSMMPTITDNDLVVCEPLERDTPIYDNHVYVIVTDVLVAKRVQKIKKGDQVQELRLISDNHQVYQPYNVALEEVKQLLKVKCRLTSYAIS